jgi:hypothetical protein
VPSTLRIAVLASSDQATAPLASGNMLVCGSCCSGSGACALAAGASKANASTATTGHGFAEKGRRIRQV